MQGGIAMSTCNESLLMEIRDLLNLVSEEQRKLASEIRELKDEQRRLKEEVRMNNIVLNNISLRTEILN
jgi:hypothetical protein